MCWVAWGYPFSTALCTVQGIDGSGAALSSKRTVLLSRNMSEASHRGGRPGKQFSAPLQAQGAQHRPSLLSLPLSVTFVCRVHTTGGQGDWEGLCLHARRLLCEVQGHQLLAACVSD